MFDSVTFIFYVTSLAHAIPLTCAFTFTLPIVINHTHPRTIETILDLGPGRFIAIHQSQFPIFRGKTDFGTAEWREEESKYMYRNVYG
jgi:hypothetical protein